jgi:hypothetical protein
MMRAKMVVQSVEKFTNASDSIKMMPVSGKAPYGPDGESEDNTFARYTPSGICSSRSRIRSSIGKISRATRSTSTSRRSRADA